MIQFALTDLFVDSVAVEAAIDRAKVRGLKKIGFMTRERAMASITDGAGASAPGSPPHSHVGTLRRFILYSFDKSANSVVVGPKYLRKRSKDAAKATEFGGLATNVKGNVIRVDARPFMGPAFNRVNQSAVPAVFANSAR